MREYVGDLVVNFSGHPLSKKAKGRLNNKFDKVEEIPIPKVDFSSNVEKQIEKIVSQVESPIDGSIPLTVILPGHSTLAFLLCAYLHGKLGHFPDICLLEKEENKYYLPKSIFYIDSQEIRDAGRAFRQKNWNNE